MNTKTNARTEQVAQPAVNQGNLAVYNERARLPYYDNFAEDYGVSQSAWKTLIDACYPSAKTVAAVVMVLQYCKARNLDPFKKPVNIVPMYSKAAKGYVETVWPGISEIRTTAHRTGGYAGIDQVECGPKIVSKWTIPESTDERTGQVYPSSEVEVVHHEWMSHTVYRIVGGVRCAFVGPRVYWLEEYATQGRSDIPNEMWRNRAIGQHEKVSEAAALRRAFPEEIGNQYSAEEMEGKTVYADAPVAREPEKVVDKKAPPPARPTPPPAVAPAAPKAETPTTDKSPPPSDTSSPATPTQDGGATTASPTEEEATEAVEEALNLSESALNFLTDIADAASAQALSAIRQDVIDDQTLSNKDKIAISGAYQKAYERVTGKKPKAKSPPPAQVAQ